MKITSIAALLVCAVFGLAGNASAAEKMFLNISGTADPGFEAEIFTYSPVSDNFADFSGSAVHIQMEIDNLSTSPFVSSFDVSWGDPSSPFPTGNGGSAYTNPFTGDDVGYISTVELSPTTFDIASGPSPYFSSFCDCGIVLQFEIDLAQPWDGAHSIIASGALGTGSIDDEAQGVFTGLGYGDEYVKGNFHINSVVAQVPEPSTWALMIGGFGLVGMRLRSRSAPRGRIGARLFGGA